MDTSEDGYQPPSDYKEDSKDPLVELSLTDSTELWLIQWPINQLQPDDFEGKELSLKLHRDGTLGSFESSSGKSYDVVSFAAQEPDATVFLPSASESKVVGKVSRRVCLVHYPEPGNMEEHSSKHSFLNSQAGSLRETSDQFKTPVQSIMKRRHGSASQAHTHSSQQKSSVMSKTSSVQGEPIKHSKRKHVDNPSPSEVSMRSMDRSTQDSGRARSSVSSVGYSDGNDSHQRKSKKRKIKVEE